MSERKMRENERDIKRNKKLRKPQYEEGYSKVLNIKVI